ncbi:MAG: hypothetical protein ABIG92_04965 [Candidatus Omnitrophota bacterium]
MKKAYIVLCCLLIVQFFKVSVSFSDQLAMTRDGKEVILKDNKTWEYLEGGREQLSVTKVDMDVKRSMKPYIERKDDIFTRLFNIDIDWDTENLDIKYRSVMEGLYYTAKRFSRDDFFSRLVKAFGAKDSEKIMWLMERWDIWRRVVSK